VWIGFIWPTILEDWSVLVNAAKNLRVPQNVGYFLTEEMIVSAGGNCSKQLVIFCIYKLLFAPLNCYVNWLTDFLEMCFADLLFSLKSLLVCVCVFVCGCVCGCLAFKRFKQWASFQGTLYFPYGIT